MFVRFRQSNGRLYASLVETRRVEGRVHQDHVAALGAVDDPPSIRARLKFWAKLPDRLARLANRIGAEEAAGIYAAIHTRVPMVTLDEQRELQKETAEADQRFWSMVRDAQAATAQDHEALGKKIEHTVAESRRAAAEADAKAALAKQRLDALARGEAIDGGFEKPMSRAEMLAALGWTERDARRAALLVDVTAVAGDDSVAAAVVKKADAAGRAALRAMAKRLGVDQGN
jgi:hypothetical protein